MWFFFAFCGFVACVAGFAAVVFPRLLGVFGVTRRWHGALVFFVGFVLFFVGMVQGIQRDNHARAAQAARAAEDATPVPLTFAAQWAPRVVSVILDVTTINQFYAQMPSEETLTPSHRREGGLLFVKWVFEDVSYIEAAFASVPGDMVLDHLLMDSVTRSQLPPVR